MSECVKCGDCCRKIPCGFVLDEVKADTSFQDRDFILEHWKPTTPLKNKLNPLMPDRCFEGFVWYECDMFEPVTNLCKDYENRPAICWSYPSEDHKSENLVSARCGFIGGVI